MTNPKVKIRRKNIEKILLAAEKVFAEQGYAGTKMADIAQQAQLPRSNLHYYFSTKDELYREVLVNLLDTWELEGACFENFDDPRVVLTSYIMEKMNHSRTRPMAPNCGPTKSCAVRRCSRTCSTSTWPRAPNSWS
jgi:Transcriptional regulator